MLFLTDNIHQKIFQPPPLGGLTALPYPQLICWETSEKLPGGSKILISFHDILNQNHFLDVYRRNGVEWVGILEYTEKNG